MIDKINELVRKTGELENKLLTLEAQQNEEMNRTNCLSFSHHFSNMEIILPKKIYITRIKPSNHSNIFFQCLVDVFLEESESVEISLIVNGLSIYKYLGVLSPGSNQVSIMQNYEPITLDRFSIYIEVTPQSRKAVYISSVTILSWGYFSDDVSPTYQALEVEDGYFLSMLSNGSIYYNLAGKETAALAFSDMTFLDNALSYSFVYSEKDYTMYLLRVDPDGNLFFGTLDKGNEIFITDNVTNVSADISDERKILVTYIKDNQCYYFEIDENKSVSVHRKLYYGYNKFVKTLCYYNKYCKKFLIIPTGELQSNFLFEELPESYFADNYISAEYNFTVTEEN